MRIGIILHPYDEDKPAGLARTIFELTKGMLEIDKKNEYIIFLKKNPCVPPDLPGKNWHAEVLGDGWFWLERLRTAEPADAYIFNTPIMPLFWRPPRTVILALDFAYWYLAPKTLKGQFSKWLTFFLHKRALGRADIVVAISDATKKELTGLFRVPQKKIRVVYCGFKRICDVPEKAITLPPKFFFFAGIIKQRKNVLNIIKAFHLFSKKDNAQALIIGGNGSGAYYDSVRQYVDDNNLKERVLFAGHLNDGELSYAYKRAEALVFPTLIEGFGYPVLEAMDCGTPVITSNQSSLAEVGGNGAALLVDPHDVGDIARAMEQIVKEPIIRTSLISKGLIQTRRFSWLKSAKEFLVILEGSDNGSGVPAQETYTAGGLVVEDKKTIIITISRGILIRNFFHSGIIKNLLLRGFCVVVVVPNSWNFSVFKGHEHPNLYFEHLPPSFTGRFKRILDMLSHGVIFNPTVHVRYKYSFSGKTPTKISYILNMLFFAPLRFMPFLVHVLRFVEQKTNTQRECDYLMERYKPSLVFNTIAGQNFCLMKSAKRYSIRTVEMPKSWDTSSYMLFRMKADYALAWGPFMRNQLIRFQRYAPQRVIMTGTAQFDFFTRKDHLLSREEFCKKFNFDPRKKIILFASSGGVDCIDEDDYIRLLQRYIKNGVLNNTQILVRPHLKYKNDRARFLPFEAHPGIIVDRTDKQNSVLRDNWDPSLEHSANLFNSLYHADVCITVISTITLDCVACGTPVININFDVKKNISSYRSVKRFYMTDYIKALTATGGTWVAGSEKEFLNALKEIVERGQKREEGRSRLINYIMYKNDGKAAERIASTLSRLAEL